MRMKKNKEQDVSQITTEAVQAELKREKVAKVTSEGGAGDKTVKKQPVAKKAKVGRNDPCPCGSGKKYKNCCLDKDLNQ